MRAMTRARRWTLVAMGCLGLNFVGLPVAANGVDQRMVSLAPQQATFSLREPVIVVLQIANGSQSSVQIDLGKNFKGGLVFDIREPDGRHAVKRLPPDGIYDDIFIRGDVSLNPGEECRKIFVLNEWQDFDEVGIYQVRVELPPSPSLAALGVDLHSASVQIRIAPRDPAKLAATCEHLAELAIHSATRSAMEAGHALRYAQDEVCLPSLARVLKESHAAKEEAVKGIAKLPAPGAVAAIVAAWDALNDLYRVVALGEFGRAGKGNALRTALELAGKRLPKTPWG